MCASTLPLKQLQRTTPISWQRRKLDYLSDKLGIRVQEDWYRVSGKQLEGIDSLLKEYNGSLFNTLRSVYSEFQWDPLNFHPVPHNVWKDTQYHRRLFDKVADSLNIQTQSDWYNVSTKDVKSFGAQTLLNEYYNTSLLRALERIYSEYEWNPLHFTSNSLPQHYWKEKKNQRKALDNIAYELGIVKQEDWYQVDHHKLLHSVQSLSRLYNSVPSMLKSIYDEFDWNFEHQTKVQHKAARKLTSMLHKNKEVTRAQMDMMALKLKVEKFEDWYHKLSGSWKGTLQTVYPEFVWNPVLFRSVPSNFWKDRNNQRHLFDWIGEELGVTTQSQWYDISPYEVKRLGAHSIIYDYYSGSLASALSSVYPEFEWNTSLLNKHERNRVTLRSTLDSLSELLRIENQTQWYSVSASQLKALSKTAEGRAFSAELNYLFKALDEQFNGSLFQALQASYPEYEWNPLYCHSMPRNALVTVEESIIKSSLDDTMQTEGQNGLLLSKMVARVSKKFGGIFQTLSKFYPEVNWTMLLHKSQGEAVLKNILRPISMVVKEKGVAGYSLDFYLPQYSLAVEFQGGQHYRQTNTGSFVERKQRDINKKQVLNELGITLVEVPYWWRGSVASLAATIFRHNEAVAADLIRLQQLQDGLRITESVNQQEYQDHLIINDSPT